MQALTKVVMVAVMGLAMSTPMAVRADDTIQDLTGTSWSGTENIGEGYGKLRFEFRRDGKVVMHDARNSVAGTYTLQGKQLAITIPQICTYVGVVNGNAFTGLGRDNTRLWNFSVTLDP